MAAPVFPPAAGAAGGTGGAWPDSLPTDTTPRSSHRNRLALRVRPNGAWLPLAGREADTARLLLDLGTSGCTAAEVTSIWWARRLSHYIWKLRQKGVPIITTLERAGDARLGRYTLDAGGIDVRRT